MTDSCIIQPITADQAPLLAKLHSECFGGAAWDLKQMQGSLALETTRGWIAAEGGGPVGFILCQIMSEQSEILTFCVRPSRQKRGVGEVLLRQAIEAARATGGSLLLEAAGDNLAARSLYEKLGFVETGRRKDYYKRGQSVVDAVLFTLRFADA